MVKSAFSLGFLRATVHDLLKGFFGLVSVEQAGVVQSFQIGQQHSEPCAECSVGSLAWARNLVLPQALDGPLNLLLHDPWLLDSGWV